MRETKKQNLDEVVNNDGAIDDTALYLALTDDRSHFHKNQRRIPSRRRLRIKYSAKAFNPLLKSLVGGR